MAAPQVFKILENAAYSCLFLADSGKYYANAADDADSPLADEEAMVKLLRTAWQEMI